MQEVYYAAETGLHYNMARDYNPSIGRYVQSDPIGLEGGVNTYGYVGGNPLSYVDQLGLQGLAAAPYMLALTYIVSTAIAAQQANTVHNSSSTVDNTTAGIASSSGGASCRNDDICRELEAEIRQIAAEIRKREEEMFIDKNQLVLKAYAEPLLGKRKGAWIGHGEKMVNQKIYLKKLIDAADRNNCFVNPYDRMALLIEPPIAPK